MNIFYKHYNYMKIGNLGSLTLIHFQLTIKNYKDFKIQDTSSFNMPILLPFMINVYDKLCRLNQTKTAHSRISHNIQVNVKVIKKGSSVTSQCQD